MDFRTAISGTFVGIGAPLALVAGIPLVPSINSTADSADAPCPESESNAKGGLQLQPD